MSEIEAASQLGLVVADILRDYIEMANPYFSLNIGGATVYAKMPGGNVKLPLSKNERDELVVALKEALEIIEDRSNQPYGAKESD